jgi:uncharacterized membrane protein YjjB (DUF3815 family)
MADSSVVMLSSLWCVIFTIPTHRYEVVAQITGILFQVPSGLSNGGLLQFASQQSSGVYNSYLSGFQTILQLISVAIGLTVGLSISLLVVYPVQSRKRVAGIFSL